MRQHTSISGKYRLILVTEVTINDKVEEITWEDLGIDIKK